MTNDYPASTIREQPLTEQPFTPDNTLVDDTVALVDDPTALVGGQTVIVENIRVSIKPYIPSSNIPRFS